MEEKKKIVLIPKSVKDQENPKPPPIEPVVLKEKKRFYRKVIKITGHDSPNVRLGLEEVRLGKKPSGKMIVPGVLSYPEYVKRLATWDQIRICIGIQAEFYEGAEVLLYPPQWLDIAAKKAVQLYQEFRQGGKQRMALGMGVDPAEGGDETSISVVDEYGLIELWSDKTPNTNDIVGRTIAMMRKYGLLNAPERVVFDRGGGGKQIADQLRAQKLSVRTVGFNESVNDDPKYGRHRMSHRLDVKELRFAYINRRAEMYGTLRLLLDPSFAEQVAARPELAVFGRIGANGFALPSCYPELRRQLSLMPLLYDSDGRMRMLPKTRKSSPGKWNPLSTVTSVSSRQKDAEPTLFDILGRSPDQADSLVLAVHGMVRPISRVKVGGIRSKDRR
jgi:hypothetical protein